MKHILLRALAVALACGACASVSCGGNASTKAKTRQTEAARPAALEIDELLASADSLAGKTVTIEGVCTHTCRHGARKIFLMGSDDTQTVRVESGELGSFDPQCVNRIVRVTGTLDEQRVDEAYLAAWEEPDEGADRRTARHDRGRLRRREGRTAGDGRHRRGALADFRAKIAARKAAEGKDYLSFYYVTATSYEIEQ